MQSLRIILGSILLPLILSACQSMPANYNSFAGLGTLAKPVKRPVTPESQLKPAEETAEIKNSDAPDAAVANLQGEKAKTESAKAIEKVAKKKPRSPKARQALRRKKYQPLIAKHAKANGVPVKLALAVVQVESSFRVNARGAAGEIGLMQLLPRTARFIGYKGKMKNLYDPDTNIRYGMKYLGKAHRLGGGSTCGTILKYNAGHGAKRMNRISREYCRRVRRIIRNG